MASLAIEASPAQEMLDLERNVHPERAQWVLNAPEPPSLWHELMDSIRETVLPHGSKFPSHKKKPGLFKLVVSVLLAIFPILYWCRNYKATKFKNDLLAGLTLASLCIPQVNTSKHGSSLSYPLLLTLLLLESIAFSCLAYYGKFHVEYWICNSGEA